MKKLTFLSLLIFGEFQLHAQDPGTVTVETAETFTEGQPIVATGTYTPEEAAPSLF
jgi:hypothetical protein